MKYLVMCIWASLLLVLTGKQAFAQNSRICDIYGTVYVESDRRFADFTIYIEKEESFADLVIFKEDNQLFADKSGLWFFTTNSGLADFRVYIEKEKHLADIKIYYTETRSFAGCR
jgi:hypothetical protein